MKLDSNLNRKKNIWNTVPATINIQWTCFVYW